MNAKILGNLFISKKDSTMKIKESLGLFTKIGICQTTFFVKKIIGLAYECRICFQGMIIQKYLVFITIAMCHILIS
jgi:hypothetical protein